MNCYLRKNKVIVSREPYPGLKEIPEALAKEKGGTVYVLNKKDPAVSRRSFAVTDPSLLFLAEEGINLMQKENSAQTEIPDWLAYKIQAGQVMSVNTAWPSWEKLLEFQQLKKWRLNIVGMGDVGGTLLTGLRLIGGEYISQIGIYDTDPSRVKRWEFEANQIRTAFCQEHYPEVYPAVEKEIFDCDMFVFCVSIGVPPVGMENKDVRLVQLEGNSRIIRIYARKAREAGFAGVFAVVSDPVDLLCRAVFDASNTGAGGKPDFLGLAPEQIRGYGLGVMNARAVYYARQDESTAHYEKEGRAFGPHGEGLIIADSIERYDDMISRELTDKARKSNLEVRGTGFKPFVAPALSSGALSLLATVKGDWHYSATFMGGVFMGAKNRLTPQGVEIERLIIPPVLIQRLEETYQMLGRF